MQEAKQYSPEQFRPSTDSYVPARMIEHLRTIPRISHRDIFELIAHMAESNAVGGYGAIDNINDETIGAVLRYDAADPEKNVVESVFMGSNPYDPIIDLEMRAYPGGIRVYRSSDGIRPATVRARLNQAQKKNFIEYVMSVMYLPHEFHKDQPAFPIRSKLVNHALNFGRISEN